MIPRFKVWLVIAVASTVFGSLAHGQRSVKRPIRATPPSFKADEFSGVFYEDAMAQLQGPMPVGVVTVAKSSPNGITASLPPMTNASASGDAIWKDLISESSLEDLVKETKTRLDSLITTPAGFAGNVTTVRREFTILATLMAVIAEYPDEIRWQSSSEYSRRIFARMADNCKVGTQPVFNEAKQRQADLQTLLKGTKLSGSAEEVSWEGTADRNPTMQIMEWALREKLAPLANNETKFKSNQDEIAKYAELLAALGQVIRKPGMVQADEEEYVQFAATMTSAAMDVTKGAKVGDAQMARTAIGRMDQACSKCHEANR
jgi:hypothetical protein